MSSVFPDGRSSLRFDPGLLALRSAVMTMAAVAATFGTAVGLESLGGFDSSLVILAVVLALTLARRDHGATLRSYASSLLRLIVIAVLAGLVGTVLTHQETLGDILLVAGLSVPIWLRRFGPAWSKFGALVSLPFLAILVSPVASSTSGGGPLWAPVMAVVAFTWVSIVQYAGARIGLVPAPIPSPARTARPSTRRFSASTSMAVQMAVSLGLAFVVGRSTFGDHWSWVVLTAFIVCSGNQGRGDVVYKGVLRVIGGVVGTLIATLITGHTPTGHTSSIIAIFVFLALSSWLRTINYAFWAGGITAVLALLYGYFGESGASLLDERLLGILVGGLLAIAGSWFVLPIRTCDVARVRTASLLESLQRFLADARESPADARTTLAALDVLQGIAPTLRAHRLISRRPGHQADALDALQAIRIPLQQLEGGHAHTPAFKRSTGELSSELGRLRRALKASSDIGELTPAIQHFTVGLAALAGRWAAG